jgi:type III secretion protein J
MHSTLRNKKNFNRFHYILLMCLCLLTSCESRKIIVNSLDEKEANEIIVYLSTKGINAVKVQAEGGGTGGGAKIVLWDISINSDQALEAMSYLNQVGLPRRRSQNLLNIFTGSGLVPSEMEQKIRYQVGLAEQIASTIRKIDGVLDAEVQISFPEEDPLNPTEKKQKITASVYIKHNGVLDDPNSHLNTKIKRLVAASVAGLDYDNVTIIGERARFNELLGNIIIPDEEKQYVSVWTVVLAKESLTRFRVLFFGFTISILLLLVALTWTLWKVYPLLKSHGGLSALFHLHHLPTTPPVESPPEDKEEEVKEAKPEKNDSADKDIDQT